MEKLLRAGYREGVRSHGRLALEFPHYSARVLELAARRSEQWASVAETPGGLRRLALGDLFLAIACDRGIAGAWERFLSEYGPRIRGLLRRHGASGRESDELVGDLPGWLFDGPGGSSRLSSYDGTGSLFGWLAVVVLRERARRQQKNLARIGSEVPGHAREPVEHVLRAEEASRFGAALRAAWRTLGSQEQAAMLYRYRHGLSLAEIAKLLRVGRPRASRVLTSGTSKLRRVVGGESFGFRWDLGCLWVHLRDAVGDHLSAAEHEGRAASPTVLRMAW